MDNANRLAIHSLHKLVCYIALLFVPATAHAGYLVGVTSGFVPGTAPQVRIDPQTGRYTEVHSQGRAYNSLAQNSVGELFGGWFSGSGDNGRVSRFDPNNGALLQTFNAITPDADSSRGLSFDANDQLFAVINRNDGSGSPTIDDDLYQFDLANETTTLIGSLGFMSVQGLDISPTGAFYVWDVGAGLLTVDPMTGAATDVNPTIGGTGAIQSIVFAPDGRLFGARENLFSIDPTTGSFTQIGSGSDYDIRGIEWVVPEPTTLPLAFFACLSMLTEPMRKSR